MTAVPLARLAELTADRDASFVLIAREGGIDLLTGDVVDVDLLADIPLDGPGGDREVFAMVPYRQVRERGFEAQDDGTPLRCVVVTEHHRLELAEVVAALPDAPIALTDGGFDISDADYADTVEQVISEEIGRGMDISPEKVREIIKVSQEPVSLETPIGEEEDSHLGDFIEDHGALAPAEAASHQLLKEQVEDVLASLTVRERRVLQLRFGLEDGRSRTLEEVGREFGVTRERIRQIEAKALRKLRHPSRSKKLKDYLD